MKMGDKGRKTLLYLVSGETLIEPRTKLTKETSFSPKIRMEDLDPTTAS